MSNIRKAIQQMLDAHGDGGWQCAQFVIVMGLERVTSEGRIESTPWIFTPRDQPEWMTDGLLEAGTNLRADAEALDD